jgi:predicted transcriptional regulator
MYITNIDSSATRRDKLNILVEILNIARKGAPKTRIMYKANMSFTSLNECLSFLQKTRLLSISAEGNRTLYRSTERGIAVLNLYSQLTELINENDNFENQIKSPPPYLLAQES